MSDPIMSAAAKSPSNAKKIKVLIILMVLIIAVVAAWKYWQATRVAPAEAYSQWTKPVPVRVVAAQRSDLPQQVKAIGTVIPSHTVNVKSQVSGMLQQLYFQEGQLVKKGQLLAQIDPATFQVALAQAQGTQQQHFAQLANAQTELKRYQLLYQRDSIAQQQVEQQQAMVKQLQGQTQANQALVDAAKLQLSYTKIYAPIAGRVGFRQKDVGNLIQANDASALLSITQVRPIYVQFSVPEQQLESLRGAMQGNATLAVAAWDRADQKQLSAGQVHALDNQIDLTTGTIKIKAIFNNLDDRLYPNQFVNVHLNVSTLRNVVSLPSDAIQHGAKGAYVFIINKESKAEVRMLKLGLNSQGRTEILSGLDGQERVVLEGIDRLSEGKQAQIVQDDRTDKSQKASTPAAESKPASAAVTAQVAAK